METVKVEKEYEGQRFDKFLKRYFKEAGSSFIYKMLRKKNIVLNGVKADGSELLKANDIMEVYFSKETFDKFRGLQSSDNVRGVGDKAYSLLKGISVLYENEHVIFLYKPVGIVSQTDEKHEYSLNEWLLGYLEASGFNLKPEIYKPSVMNRIDCNTEGIVMGAKTYKGSRYLADCIKNHKLVKEYYAICEGVFSGEGVLKGYLYKDKNANKVYIYDNKKDGADYIETKYDVIASNEHYTLCRINLITGKSHQIRAHMAHIGHPLAGDIKYGGKPYMSKKYQMLIAGALSFDENAVADSGIFDKPVRISATLPDYFNLT